MKDKELTKIEKRSISHEVRVNVDNDRLVDGYALLFNSESQDLGGFIEVIEEGALEGVIERSDVFCLLNHSDNRGILARSLNGSGSLILEVDDKGLRYMFESPRTALGDELLEYLKRGDITGSSFAFEIDEDEWFELENGMYKRHIKKFKLLHDVSPVWNPAYLSTSVAQRSLEKLENEKQNHRNKELEKYFTEIRKKYKIK